MIETAYILNGLEQSVMNLNRVNSSIRYVSNILMESDCNIIKGVQLKRIERNIYKNVRRENFRRFLKHLEEKGL